MKKYSKVLFLCVFLLFFSTSAFGEGSYLVELEENSIKIITSSIAVKSKVIVEKGSERYYYSLNDIEENLPLQLGSGKYMVKVVEHISGNKYKVIKKSEFDVKDECIKDLYTGSNQPIYWKGQNEIIKLGNKLTKNINNDMEKVKIIYSYIVKI